MLAGGCQLRLRWAHPPCPPVQPKGAELCCAAPISSLPLFPSGSPGPARSHISLLTCGPPSTAPNYPTLGGTRLGGRTEVAGGRVARHRISNRVAPTAEMRACAGGGKVVLHRRSPATAAAAAVAAPACRRQSAGEQQHLPQRSAQQCWRLPRAHKRLRRGAGRSAIGCQRSHAAHAGGSADSIAPPSECVGSE